jgi:hypothetical protein
VPKPVRHSSTKPKTAPPAPPTQAVAPNGIAITGGTVTNPTVNNYEPPQRTLSPSQRSELIELLRISGPFTITVRCAQGNFEAQTYSDSLISVLREAGWTVPANLLFITEVRQGQGLQIIMNDVKNAPPSAVVLYNDLKQAGVDVVGGVSMPGQVAPDSAILYVGVR